MTSYAERLKKEHGAHVSLVVAPQGEDWHAWYFILVPEVKTQRFAKDVTAGPVDLGHYGEVVARGWGDYPPPDVIAQMQELYGFDSSRLDS